MKEFMSQVAHRLSFQADFNMVSSASFFDDSRRDLQSRIYTVSQKGHL